MEAHTDDDVDAGDPSRGTGTIVPPICFHPERRSLPAALLAASLLASAAAAVTLAWWLL
jgi:hypothetical protein